MSRTFTSTEPQAGDTQTTLLGKLNQTLGGVSRWGATDTEILASILERVNAGAGAGGAGAGAYFTKVGTAYIGGDQTGNARGAAALDVQSTRGAATQVASGNQAATFGYDNTASGDFSTAVGSVNTVTGSGSVAVGRACDATNQFSAAIGRAAVASGDTSTAIGSNVTASGDASSAIGRLCVASNVQASAFGYSCTAAGVGSSAFGVGSAATVDNSFALGRDAVAEVIGTSNIAPAQIVRKTAGISLSDTLKRLCGVEVVLAWPDADLTTVADYSFTVPAGSHFYPDEVGVIVTSATAVSVQPTVRFGNAGTPAKFLAATITTTAAVQFDRQRFSTLLSAAGEASLSAGVTTAATATAMRGRFYIKGIFVGDE